MIIRSRHRTHHQVNPPCDPSALRYPRILPPDLQCQNFTRKGYRIANLGSSLSFYAPCIGSRERCVGLEEVGGVVGLHRNDSGRPLDCKSVILQTVETVFNSDRGKLRGIAEKVIEHAELQRVS